MSGAPRVRSMNVADSEARPVLGPTGNTKAGPLTSARKPASKQLRKDGKSPEEAKLGEEKKVLTVPTVGNLSPKSLSGNFSSVLRRHEQLLHSNLSLNASCSSDASTDSFHSRASTGRLIRSNNVGTRRKQYVSKPRSVVSDGGLESLPSSDGSQSKKSCAWVTPNTGMFSLLWFNFFPFFYERYSWIVTLIICRALHTVYINCYQFVFLNHIKNLPEISFEFNAMNVE